MLRLVKKEHIIRVETAGADFEWDLARGAQLTACVLKNRQAVHSLFGKTPAPNLTLTLGDRKISLADAPAEASILREDAQCIVFTTKSVIGGGLFSVEQRYEVFREGVVFCEFSVTLEAGKTVVIRRAEMGFAIAMEGVKQFRGNAITRDPYPKQDVTTVHILSEAKVGLLREERIEKPHVMPLIGADLGWAESRYYSNRVEFVLEDSTSFGSGLVGKTRSTAGLDGKSWNVSYSLREDGEQVLQAPFFYRNRWALLCGSARRESGEGADRALANNSLAARICHVMYPYVRGAQEWPWCSVPVRQTFYQDVQLAKENPTLEQVDEAAALGCNLMIIHQFWMTNGGSNGEPCAEYKAFDPAWMKSFIGRAHDKGMRVLLYCRGIERYSMYSDFFEQYLRKDWDGVYMDWATPAAMGFCKTSAMHFSAYDYFMFTRAMRNRVGDRGVMIAHSSVQTYLSQASFDSVVCGEFSVMHSGLLSTPEKSASFAMQGGCGINLIAGNSADRAVFSSQRSAGFAAGMGYSAHPFMEPGKSFTEASGYMHALWNVWRALGSDPVRCFNPATGDSAVATWQGNLHPVVYQAQNGSILVTVANLGEEEVTGDVTVDLKALGLHEGCALVPLAIKGTHPIAVRGNRLVVEKMPPYFFAGAVCRV